MILPKKQNVVYKNVISLTPNHPLQIVKPL